MTTVTVYTAERMQAIEDNTIIDASVVNGRLILEKFDGSQVDVGPIFQPIRDTAANLATANLIYPAGQLIQQTDGAQMLAMGDGTNSYNTLPKYSVGDIAAYQYAYTETINTATTTQADWTGLTITFTSDGVTPIEIEAFCPASNATGASTAGSSGSLYIMEGATQIQSGQSAAAYAASAKTGHILVKDTRVYSAGVHTVKVQTKQTAGTGNVAMVAASGNRAYIRSKLAHL